MSKALATTRNGQQASEAKSSRESISELPDGSDNDDDTKSTPEDERPHSLKTESDNSRVEIEIRFEFNTSVLDQPPSSTQDPKNHTFTFGNSDTSAKMIQQAAAQFKKTEEDKYQIQTTTTIPPPASIPINQQHAIRPFNPSSVPKMPMSFPSAPHYDQDYDGLHTSWDYGGYNQPLYDQYGMGQAAFYDAPLPMMVPYSAPAPPPLPTSYGQRRSFDSRRSFDDHKYKWENKHTNQDPGSDKDSGRDWRCLIGMTCTVCLITLSAIVVILLR